MIGAAAKRPASQPVNSATGSPINGLVSQMLTLKGQNQDHLQINEVRRTSKPNRGTTGCRFYELTSPTVKPPRRLREPPGRPRRLPFTFWPVVLVEGWGRGQGTIPRPALNRLSPFGAETSVPSARCLSRRRCGSRSVDHAERFRPRGDFERDYLSSGRWKRAARFPRPQIVRVSTVFQRPDYETSGKRPTRRGSAAPLLTVHSGQSTTHPP